MRRTSSFESFVRTGRPATDTVETKFNPWHDPDDGRFTFAGQGRNFGHPASRTADDASRGSTRSNRSIPNNGGIARSSAGLSNRSLAARPALSPQTRKPGNSTAPKLKAAAQKLRSGESRLVTVGRLKIVQFGPGVELIPVAVAPVEEFSAATAQGTSMFHLDAVITGPQFKLLRGSSGLHGQAVVNGRILGNSAPEMYYMATVQGPKGSTRLKFGKGDPPPTDVSVGFGGAVPLLINGLPVPGYNKAWERYNERGRTGKNIVVYSSSTNTAGLFIQPDGASGYSLENLRAYIKAAGYDYAVLYDGSGSTSLRYKGKAIVNPALEREPVIPLAIGFRGKRH